METIAVFASNVTKTELRSAKSFSIKVTNDIIYADAESVINNYKD